MRILVRIINGVKITKCKEKPEMLIKIVNHFVLNDSHFSKGFEFSLSLLAPFFCSEDVRIKSSFLL